MKLLEKMPDWIMNLVNPLAQSVAHHNPEKTVTPGMPEILRHASAQGAVLLENRVLPFETGAKVAVFGRVQQDWFCISSTMRVVAVAMTSSSLVGTIRVRTLAPGVEISSSLKRKLKKKALLRLHISDPFTDLIS